MLAFNNPWYLLLLGLLPLLAWASYRSLAGLGRWRRWFAIVLRSLVMALLICALAEMQYQRASDRLTVIYLLDQSRSIPESRRAAMIRYANASIRDQRNAAQEDRAGVIVFGRDAEVEVPPVDFDIQLMPRIESLLDPDFTNLAGAMQRAMAMFPHDAAKRVVVVTDGNENIGDALEQARAMADAGVSIDVLPVPLERRSEVSVETVAIPADVRRDQPFEMRVVLDNAVSGSPDNVVRGSPDPAQAQTEGLHSSDKGRPSVDGVARSGDRPQHAGDRPQQSVSGRIRIVRKAGQREETLADAPVEVPPGKRVFTLREDIDQPDFYTYEARFVPDDPADDTLPQNNVATAFTHVQGQGQVLLIENWEEPGEFDYLVDRLRDEGLEVVVEPSNRLFTSLPELQRYDTVILADVPRSSGEDANNVSSFSDEQIRMLVRNTEELGCGLIMLGGPNSFGAGGWANTDLEKAMPVDFQIKSAKVVPVGALVLNMHAGEIPQANYWQKVISEEAIKALGPRDYCGLISWNGTDQWLWGQSQGGMLRVGPNRQLMLSRIDRMTIGDMPEFDPSMKKAAAAFANLASSQDAPAIKHMIIISDGDPSPPNPSTITALKAGNVKVTTVAVGSHGILGNQTMQSIATRTGGKYYVVSNANALPKIYQREARRIAKPLVYEPKPPVSPLITTQHEIVQGLEGAFPPVSGFVLTSVKQNSLVEVVLRSPLPAEADNSTIMAAWTYGLGKAVAFTTDAGQRWTTSWTGWDEYDRLFSQMVRWSMRPTGDTGNFTIATDVQGNKTQVVITALDKEDEFLNYLPITGSVLGPDMQPIPLEIEQTAPGRYVGRFDSSAAGSYMILVQPGAGQAMIRTGVNVGYSDEFRQRDTNTPLLESLARLPAKHGKPGNLMEPLPAVPEEGVERALAAQLAVDPYRRDLPQAVASQDIWPWLVMAASCLFLADVFVRRVQVSFGWLVPLWLRMTGIVLRRERAAAAPETMSRLRSRKAEVDRALDSRRAGARFEPDADVHVDRSVAEATQAGPTAPGAKEPTPHTPIAEEKKVEDSYTERLLKAKKQVWKDRKKDGGQ